MLTKRDIVEQTNQLFQKYNEEKDADLKIQIRNEIVNLNLPLAKDIANRLNRGDNLTKEDYFQTAVVALISCVEKYDINANVKFSTYCYKSMANEIINKNKNDWKHKDLIDSMEEEKEIPLSEFNIKYSYDESLAQDKDSCDIVCERENKRLLNLAISHLSYLEEYALRYKEFADKNAKILIDKSHFSSPTFNILNNRAKDKLIKMIKWNFSYASIFGFDVNCEDSTVEYKLNALPEVLRYQIFSAYGLKGFRRLTIEEMKYVYLQDECKRSSVIMKSVQNSIAYLEASNFENRPNLKHSLNDIGECKKRLAQIKALPDTYCVNRSNEEM